MASNKTLNNAKNAKYDEFYTRIGDVSNELKHYKQHFKDKVVFCNCDDPTWSAFWRYFHLNFEVLGLKQLVSTHYDKTEPTYKMVYNGGDDNNVEVGEKTPLAGNGDFRNAECIELLAKSDIIVTNPPFSLFREYMEQLMTYDKKFIIIGNNGAISYKEIFPLLKNDKIWLGMLSWNAELYFRTTEEYAKYLVENKKYGSAYRIIDGEVFARSGCMWYTNLDIAKRHEKLILWKKYNDGNYPHYINYDGIDVAKLEDIPCDYKGAMGVPISFLDKYNPDQFEIIGLADSNLGKEMGVYCEESIFQKYYAMNKSLRRGNVFYLDENGHPKKPYGRVIIKRKENKQ